MYLPIFLRMTTIRPKTGIFVLISKTAVEDRSNLNVEVSNSSADQGGTVIGAININKTEPRQ